MTHLKLFFFLVALNTSTAFSQDYSQCPEAEKSCGPKSEIASRVRIEDKKLQEAPYAYIVHQEITSWSTNYSTGSFIAPNILITAHHNVFQALFIRRLKFCNKSVSKDKWISFKRKEVKIYHYKSVKAPTDISVIVFKNPSKIHEIYKGCFEVNDYKNANKELVHLTGFPCDLPDILIDKSLAYDSLKTIKDTSLLGYYIYTCTGDSGAPLWIANDDKPTIIGIHHGGGEDYFDDDYNCSAEITDDVIKWLQDVKQENP